MVNEGIVFQQQRNFGEILNATFTFISQEFKTFLKSLFFFCGPFILIGTFFIGMNQYSAFSNLSSLNNSTFTGKFAITYLVGYFFLFLGIVMIMNTVYSYIKMYNTFGKKGFTIENLWYEVKKNFMIFFITNFLLALIYILVGCVSIIFAFFPLFYILIVTQLVFPIRIFENRNFSEAFSRSFQLIKQRWFFTFGLLSITTLVINFISGVVSLPITSLAGILTYATGIDDGNKILSMIILVYYSLALISYYILMSVVFIVINFQYFNLIEEKEHPSLFRRIKEINAENII